MTSDSAIWGTGLSGDCQVFVFSIRTVIQEVENEKICFPYKYYREQKPSVVRGDWDRRLMVGFRQGIIGLQSFFIGFRSNAELGQSKLKLFLKNRNEGRNKWLIL